MAFNEQEGLAVSGVVHSTMNEDVDGVKTFLQDPIVPEEIYGVGWNGSLEPPTKNAVYDKMETKADDANLVHLSGIETITGVKTFGANPLIVDEVYGSGWNGSLEPPTKNALYDKILALAQTLEEVLTAGSTIAGNHTIDIGAFQLIFSTGTAGVNPVRITATTGIGLSTYATSGEAINASATSGRAIHGSVTGANAAILLDKVTAGTNAVMSMLDISGQTSGTAAAGLGVAMDFYLESNSGATPNACRVQVIWTDATNATVTSKYEIQLEDGGSLVTRLSLAGNGKLTLPTYGTGAHVAANSYKLGSASGGGIVEREQPKEYKSIWEQTLTGDPTIVADRVNDFGGLFVLARSIAGIYTATRTAAFPDADKFFIVSVMMMTASKFRNFIAHVTASNELTIEVYDAAGILTDIDGRISIYFEQYA